MTDQPSTPPDGQPQDTTRPAADETFGWTPEPDAEPSQGGAGAAAERMLSPLQSMIDSVATQATPVVRQIGLKAAELAAAAADRAGPIAHKAADATADASTRIAERSRVIAAELRRDIANASTNGESATAETTAPTAVLEPESSPDAPTGPSGGDEPAEGPR
jgi:hypothetical protein